MCLLIKPTFYDLPKIPVGMTFMSALLKADFIGEEGDIMNFTEPPPWAWKKYTSLYIRDSYKDLHDIIWDILWQTNQNVVVIGNPGIGKSFFAVYELYIALKKRKTVVFQSVPARKTYLFRPSGAVEELPYPNAPTLSETETLLLYDAGTKREPQFSNICNRIIVFSSPCESSYADLLKEGAHTLCMPTWSMKEIEYCREHMKSYSSLKKTTVSKRFMKYGGIARFVLEVDEHIERRHSEELEQAISLCNTQTLRDVVRSQDRAVQSHKVLHRTVVENDDGTTNYYWYSFEFGSKQIEDKVYEEINQKAKLDLMKFLHDSRDETVVATLRGCLFERLAHDLLANGGKFKIRQLFGQQEQCTTKVKKREKKNFSELTELNSQENGYFLPTSKTFPAVDAIVPSIGIALQMTVSTTHPIHAGGLMKVIKACGNPAPFRLFFVIPDYIFDDFKQQKYKNIPANISSIGCVRQYALSIPLCK